MSEKLDPDSGTKDTDREIERIEEFIRSYDDQDIEFRPDPSSYEQTDVAKTLSVLMIDYKKLKRGLRNGSVSKEAFLRKRTSLIDDLELLISQAKALYIIHDGSQRIKKLKECEEKLRESQEDNWKLSQQLLEYKNRLGIPKE